MSAKHTPGPWSVPHFAQPDAGCECKYVLTDGYMGAVASVHCSGEGNWSETGDNPRFEEAVANAYLIAAAPDMFAALKLFLSEHDATYDGGTMEMGRFVDMARSAVAKAKQT